MIAILLAFLALQVNPGPTGIASGIVSTANGTPAAGIRVFAIPAGTSDSVTVNATVFEGLTQTDASGRYRLVIPPGRYYIGAGAVNSPTYYPNTTNIASAKAIVVSAESTLDNINFSQYVAPGAGNLLAGFIATPLVLPPGSTGRLSGIIKASDGTPAVGLPVLLIPSSTVNSAIAGNSPNLPIRFLASGTSVNSFTIFPTQAGTFLSGVYTDNAGHYRFDTIPPNTYNILAGYSNSPRLYPGTSDVATAQSITTTPTTTLDTLDFTLAPPSPNFAVLQGKVLGIGGRPAGGAVVTLIGNIANATGLASLLPSPATRQIRNDGNGSYRFDGLSAGSYTVRAELPGYPLQTREVQVSGQTDADFDFQINTMLGRIRWDDGTPFNEPMINQAAVSTVSNPNVIMTDLIPVARDGIFSKAISAGEYRFYIRNLPSGIAVASVTTGGNDISNTSFAFNGKDALDIEVRLTRNIQTGTRISGIILDAPTGNPPPAERVVLCCLKSGPFEKISAPLQRDGSFEFFHVPEGEYKVELQSTQTLTVAGAAVDVGKTEIQNLRLLSSALVSASLVQVVTDSGAALPPESRIKVTWTTLNSGIPITTYASPEGMLWTLPASSQFELKVSDLPQDRKIKSITSSGQPLLLTSPSMRVTSPTSIVITLEPQNP